MILKPKLIAAVLCMPLLAGCLSLLPEAASAPSIYKLTDPVLMSEKDKDATVIMISRPISAKAISGEDIILAPGGQRIAYAANARWVEPVPNLFQQAIVDAFSVQPGMSAVASPSTVRSDFILQVNLRSFEAAFDKGENSAPMANVFLTATLTDTRSRTLLGTQQFSGTQRAEDVSVSAIVFSKRIATQSALADLSDWVGRQTQSGS